MEGEEGEREDGLGQAEGGADGDGAVLDFAGAKRRRGARTHGAGARGAQGSGVCAGGKAKGDMGAILDFEAALLDLGRAHIARGMNPWYVAQILAAHAAQITSLRLAESDEEDAFLRAKLRESLADKMLSNLGKAE